ncbi:MAG: LAGLIDADG family homing endonuclease [Acidimicrobiia bacterium]
MRPATDASAAFLAGFVAAEGSFIRTGGRFRLAVGLGATDAGMCHTLQEFLGCGRIHTFPRRAAHYDDEVQFVVTSIRDHIERVVPFMDAHLPPSHKRAQFEAWRDDLVVHWETRARRRRRCTIPGCEERQRAHGLCRHHLWVLRRE